MGCFLQHWLHNHQWSTWLPSGSSLGPVRGSWGLCVDPPAPRVPATLAIRRASWFLGVLERFWPRCRLPVERALRRWTSVALKKATMKGCLFWGPCRPIRPANLGLMLCPRPEAAKRIGDGYRRGGWGGCMHASQFSHTIASSTGLCYSALALCQVVLGAESTVRNYAEKTVPWAGHLVGQAGRYPREKLKQEGAQQVT